MNEENVVGYFSSEKKEVSRPCDLFLLRKNANGGLYADLPFMKTFMSLSMEEYNAWLSGEFLNTVTELNKGDFENILFNK